ncbi:MAG: putative DNA-binding regulatory protein [Labilithrix sp.]|nr:putative DNA-binding regulatory protein [Labilithrix sp.]
MKDERGDGQAEEGVKRTAREDLRAVVAAARAAWPEIDFEEDAFLEFVRSRPLRRAAASRENAGDLLLAFRCTRGDPGAVCILEREYLARLGDSLPVRLREDAAEVVQALRERLLVSAPGRPPRIESFTGRGGMESWLRVAAVRVAMNLQRSRRREVALDEDRVLAERAGGDLEIDDLKRRYLSDFRAAFSAALLALAPRDRTILRQHYLDGLTMEAIGKLHRVHRITVVRWMDTARVALAHETRRELSTRLRIDRGELESILRLIESQMDVSIRAFLGKD